ncbi:hypothetical protein, partial [Burkholderia ambifaria]
KPASASFKMPMICSSVNRFFIAVPLWSGLYTVTVLNAGGRSMPHQDASEMLAWKPFQFGMVCEPSSSTH